MMMIETTYKDFTFAVLYRFPVKKLVRKSRLTLLYWPFLKGDLNGRPLAGDILSIFSEADGARGDVHYSPQ